jgi:uncharacterized protein (DUF58 family)
MRLTRRGLGAAFVAVALLAASAYFADLIIGIAFLCVMFALVSEAVWIRIALRKPETKIRLTVEEARNRKIVLYPGDESLLGVRLSREIGGRLELQSALSFTTIEPTSIDGGAREARLQLRFNTQYSGRYSSDSIFISVMGPIGLFNEGTSISLSQEYMVHPRLVSVAAATVRLLGRTGMGETSIELPGAGSELYEMRTYQAGDDFRSVNWNATARQGTLMVNEHMKEIGDSFLLVLDARAPGFRDLDRLASTFLLLANGFASAGVGFGVLVHDGSEVTALTEDNDPSASLNIALAAALSVTKLEHDPEFLELLPARASLKARAGEGNGSTMVAIRELRRLQLLSTVKGTDPWATAAGYVRDRSTRRVVYVSGLFADLEPLIELAWQARHLHDAEFSVANPCDSAARAATDSEEGVLKIRNQGSSHELLAAGVTYFRGNPQQLVQTVLSA